MKTIGMLFSESRLIAKTIDKIIIERDFVDLHSWKIKGKLLTSNQGDCLSSATLLVKGEHVPTYGIDGRCYGFLLNAEKCSIYDVNSTDANTNRTDKLAKRAARKKLDLLSNNDQNIKTLDELSDEIKTNKKGVMNEVLLDAWQESVVGLFVRKINLSQANPTTLKYYYLSLCEIKLIQKYFIQAFGFSENLPICLYDEVSGKLFNFPNDSYLFSQAQLHQVHQRNYPELFRLLSENYVFEPIPQPETVEQYLDSHPKVKDFAPFRPTIIKKLMKKFLPFDDRMVNKDTILNEPVDDTTGLDQQIINETVAKYIKLNHMENTSPIITRYHFYSHTHHHDKMHVKPEDNITEPLPS